VGESLIFKIILNTYNMKNPEKILVEGAPEKEGGIKEEEVIVFLKKYYSDVDPSNYDLFFEDAEKEIARRRKYFPDKPKQEYKNEEEELVAISEKNFANRKRNNKFTDEQFEIAKKLQLENHFLENFLINAKHPLREEYIDNSLINEYDPETGGGPLAQAESATPFATGWLEVIENDKLKEGLVLQSNDNRSVAELREIKVATKIRDYLRTKLKDDILIDLGGGYGRMFFAAEDLGVGTYINVDKMITHQTDYNPFEAVCNHFQESLIKDLGGEELKARRINVAADMLFFLTLLPDNSVNIAINGIDRTIVDSKYSKALANEIIRVTKKGGVILGTNSDALIDIANIVNHGESDVTLPEDYNDLEKLDKYPASFFRSDNVIFEKK
jgi:hypothetical protein